MSETPRKRGRPRKRKLSGNSPKDPEIASKILPEKSVVKESGRSEKELTWDSFFNEDFSDEKFSEVTSFDVELFNSAQKQDRVTSSSRGDDNANSSPPGTKQPPKIRIGEHVIQAFYVSQHSFRFEDYDTIFICEYCMKYWISSEVFNYHRNRCSAWNPPGNEVYRKDGISVFEVDAQNAKDYCISVCLLSKLFLLDKVLCFDVDPFYFYVLMEHSSTAMHFVGYFSKPKEKGELNLSCVMILPSYQRKGYGRFLIDFSYALSRKEGTWGTPDKPLSSFGRRAYDSYWKSALLEYFYSRKGFLASVTLHEIRSDTGIKEEDILETLMKLGFLHRCKSETQTVPQMQGKHSHRKRSRALKNSHRKTSPVVKDSHKIEPAPAQDTPQMDELIIALDNHHSRIPMLAETSYCFNHQFYLKINWRLVQESHMKLHSKSLPMVDVAALNLRVNLHRKYASLFETSEAMEEIELKKFLEMQPFESSDNTGSSLESQSSAEDSLSENFIEEIIPSQNNTSLPEAFLEEVASEAHLYTKISEHSKSQFEEPSQSSEIQLFVELEVIKASMQPMDNSPTDKVSESEPMAESLVISENVDGTHCPSGASIQIPNLSDTRWNNCRSLVLYDPNFVKQRFWASLV